MIRTLLAASVLAFSVGAMAEGTAPAAPAAAPATTATSPASGEPTMAAPAPAKAAGKTKEDCMKEGHKKGKELKKCMSGK